MTLLARDHRGHAQPVPALARCASHRGLLLQAAHGPRAAATSTPRASSPPPAARRARSRPGCGSASTTRPAQAAAEFQDIFGKENFFLELMDHGLDIERRVRDGPAAARARTSASRCVATNDLHYTHARGRRGARALLCVQSGSTLTDPNRFKFDGDDYYLKSPQPRCGDLWRELPEACDNTLLIAERCDVAFTEGDGTLHAALPRARGRERGRPGSSRRSSAACARRYPDGIPDDAPQAGRLRDRRHHPDGLPAATSSSSPTSSTGPRTTASGSGPGRGSGAGSMVAYAHAASPTSTRSRTA